MASPMVIISVLVFVQVIPNRAGRMIMDDASVHLNVNNNAYYSSRDDVATVASKKAGSDDLDNQKALFPFPISGGVGAGISANGRMGGFNIPGFGPVGRDVSGGMGMGGGMGIGGGTGVGNGAGVSGGGGMSSGVGGLGGDSAGGFGTGAPVGFGGGPFGGIGDTQSFP